MFDGFVFWLVVAEILWWIVVALGIRTWFRMRKEFDDIPIEYL